MTAIRPLFRPLKHKAPSNLLLNGALFFVWVVPAGLELPFKIGYHEALN